MSQTKLPAKRHRTSDEIEESSQPKGEEKDEKKKNKTSRTTRNSIRIANSLDNLPVTRSAKKRKTNKPNTVYHGRFHMQFGDEKMSGNSHICTTKKFEKREDAVEEIYQMLGVKLCKKVPFAMLTNRIHDPASLSGREFFKQVYDIFYEQATMSEMYAVVTVFQITDGEFVDETVADSTLAKIKIKSQVGSIQTAIPAATAATTTAAAAAAVDDGEYAGDEVAQGISDYLMQVQAAAFANFF